MSSSVPAEFEYSPEFQQLLRELSAPKREWPNYQQYIIDNLGGQAGRYAHFRLETLPEIEYHCGGLSEKCVLDFGCGTGSTTVALAERAVHVVGFDIDATRAALCQRRAHEHGLGHRVSTFSDLTTMVQARSQFHLVVLNGVLEHVPASVAGLRETVLAQAASLVSPGGYLFINDTPNRLFPLDLHTTQLWWIPWTAPGSPWAYRHSIKKHRFFPAADLSAGPRGLEEAGAWGITYWTIDRLLRRHGFSCVNLATGHRRRLRYHPVRSSRLRGVFEHLIYAVGPIALRVPLTALMPNLTNLTFRKSPARIPNV